MRNHGPFKQDEAIQVAAQTNPGAKFFVSDVEISPKSACQTCGYSLYWCECDNPIVLGEKVRISMP